MLEYYNLKNNFETLQNLKKSFERDYDDFYIRYKNSKHLHIKYFINNCTPRRLKMPEKICFIDYRKCSGRYKDSFMITMLFKNDIHTINGFNIKEYFNLYNNYELYKIDSFRYSFNKPFKNKMFYDFYLNGIIERNGLESDFYLEQRLEFDEILKYFEEIIEEYKTYYFVNLDYIMQNIMNEKYEIISEKFNKMFN